VNILKLIVLKDNTKYQVIHNRKLSEMLTVRGGESGKVSTCFCIKKHIETFARSIVLPVSFLKMSIAISFCYSMYNLDEKIIPTY